MDTIIDALKREKVSVRAAIVAIITAIAAVFGASIDEPIWQSVLVVVTGGFDAWLISVARNKVTPLDDPRLPENDVVAGFEPVI